MESVNSQIEKALSQLQRHSTVVSLAIKIDENAQEVLAIKADDNAQEVYHFAETTPAIPHNVTLKIDTKAETGLFRKELSSI